MKTIRFADEINQETKESYNAKRGEIKKEYGIYLMPDNLLNTFSIEELTYSNFIGTLDDFRYHVEIARREGKI